MTFVNIPAEFTEPANETATSKLLRLGDLLEPALEQAERRRSGEERPVPVPFPQCSDVLCGGLWAGVHVLVAGTGTGKSTFAFQIATHAAQQMCPVLYVGLELGKFQVALRALGEASGTSWSRMYTGRCTEQDIARARQVAPALQGLPFYCEFNTAQGWAPSTLLARAEQIRREHPVGPMLVVLDFLQLVGSEPRAFGRDPELRERISRAAYTGVHVANEFGASVLLISSAARDKYGLLAGDAKGAGLGSRKLPGHIEASRTIGNPDMLIGLGKESGEIEFAAESQTVLIKWPEPLESGERAVIAAVPKLRYGLPTWVPFAFWRRFTELPFQSLDDLPQPPQGQRGGRRRVAAEDRAAAVLETIARLGTCTRNQAVMATKGQRQATLDAISDLIQAGKLTCSESGHLSRPENDNSGGR